MALVVKLGKDFTVIVLRAHEFDIDFINDF
jgi:hypothetical protein